MCVLFNMTSLENLYTGEPAEAQHMLNNFWTMITDEIKNVQSVSYACYVTKYIGHFEVSDQLTDYQPLIYFCFVYKHEYITAYCVVLFSSLLTSRDVKTVF